MSNSKEGRGRPRGTGIDDRKTLQAIAAAICETPGTRPTTAIRRLGVSDPSVVRRLRDKYQEIEIELMAELRAAKAARIESPGIHFPRPSLVVETKSARMPRAGSREARLPSAEAGQILAATHVPPTVAAQAPPPPRRDVPSLPTPLTNSLFALAPASFAATWCGVGLTTVGAAVRMQADMVGIWATWPPVALMMRNQLALNEIMLSLYKPRRSPSAAHH